MQQCKATGLSLPVSLMEKIDTERGDISRSKYILRLIQKNYVSVEVRNKKKVSQTASRVGSPSSQSAIVDTKTALERDSDHA